MRLEEALPELVADLESPLVHLGRGDLVLQLKDAVLQGWRYDDFADATYLELTAEAPAETVSLYDEAGVNLELDGRGRLCRIEVLNGRDLAQRLEDAR